MEDIKKIIKSVAKKNYLFRLLFTVIAIFGIALIYNLFLLPNNIVTGGVSGLAIITKTLFGWTPATFILIANIVLILVSFIFLGKDTTMRTIAGSILYPIFISITVPLAEYLIPYLSFENFLVPILLFAVLNGILNGIIYKSGFTTGGSDILMQLANKYLKITMGKANFITSLILLMTGGLVYGIDKFIYAIVYIYLSNQLVDKIIIGISDSKMFFIHTDNPEKIQDYIIKELKAGVTIIDVEGGYSKEKGKLLMTVIPTFDYYNFKETVLAIDKNAFFVINDCYEVKGGVKREKLPFY